MSATRKIRYTVMVRNEGDLITQGVFTTYERALDLARKVNEAFAALSPRPDAVAVVAKIYPEISARGILAALGFHRKG